MAKHRISLAVVVGILIGVGCLIVRRRFYPAGNHLSPIERDGLVAFVLLAGSYVVLRCRHEDVEFYSAANPEFDGKKRLRTLTYLGWLFFAVGFGFILRFIATLLRK